MFQVVLDLIPSKCIVVLGQLTCCLNGKSSVIRGMIVIQEERVHKVCKDLHHSGAALGLE